MISVSESPSPCDSANYSDAPRASSWSLAPTGCGKSTTLFGALKTIYQPGIKILTAENPIEYICDGFSQHEVDHRIGNTFATYLRSFLRPDPDVIMVGEIRDAATANSPSGRPRPVTSC
jgi:Tfp pilus assembly ATPase PilU